jgi:hypothetical protein
MFNLDSWFNLKPDYSASMQTIGTSVCEDVTFCEGVSLRGEREAVVSIVDDVCRTQVSLRRSTAAAMTLRSVGQGLRSPRGMPGPAKQKNLGVRAFFKEKALSTLRRSLQHQR